MKALKIIVTALLSMLLFASGIAAEAVALAHYTVLDPAFYGTAEKSAYDLIGRFVVRKLSDAVLERVPAIALRTTNPEQAYLLASDALPPERVSAMLEGSGPEIAAFLLHGGDVPVLKGADAFEAAQAKVVKSLIMEELWNKIPATVTFPAFMPFTPEWNRVYGQQLVQDLWLLRYYMGFIVQALLLSLAASTLVASLLYLLWVRNRKPFFTVTGVLLCVNSLLLMLPAAILAYYSQSLAAEAAALYPVNAVAALFTADFPALFSTALRPFREIFFVSALVSMSFGLTMFTTGMPAKRQPEILKSHNTHHNRKSKEPKHMRLESPGNL